LGDVIEPEIRELIETDDLATLAGILVELDAPDVAELVAHLSDEELAVVFGLLGFALLYLDRKLPSYARSHPILKCVVLAGSTIFLGVAFLKLL
ncbi:MAG: hypothetical protein U9Q07_11200, partial [Planctomycetota bacterium]|nr:hypothetical protein [Planctomycetota bacterium]